MPVETSEECDVGDADASSFPRCVSCGMPVTMVTVTDPLEAVASPCGCRIAPGVLESD